MWGKRMKCKFNETASYILYSIIFINVLLLILGYIIQRNYELYGRDNLYNSTSGLITIIFISILPSILALVLNVFIFDRTIKFDDNEIKIKGIFKTSTIKVNEIKSIKIKNKWIIISKNKIDENDSFDEYLFDKNSICIHFSKKANLCLKMLRNNPNLII